MGDLPSNIKLNWSAGFGYNLISLRYIIQFIILLLKCYGNEHMKTLYNYNHVKMTLSLSLLVYFVPSLSILSSQFSTLSTSFSLPLSFPFFSTPISFWCPFLFSLPDPSLCRCRDTSDWQILFPWLLEVVYRGWLSESMSRWWREETWQAARIFATDICLICNIITCLISEEN